MERNVGPVQGYRLSGWRIVRSTDSNNRGDPGLKLSEWDTNLSHPDKLQETSECCF